MTVPASASISEMIGQSVEVLTKPSVQTFERFENRWTVRDAAIYVGVGALITGLFGLTGGVGGFIAGVLSTLAGFFAFSYLVYLIGKNQGGTGTFDEVAYTFALFWVPIGILVALVTLLLVITLIGIVFIPLLAILALVFNVYLAYLAVQASMNMSDTGKIWITLIAAAVGSWVATAVVAAIL